MLVTEVFLRFGVPRYLHSDQAPEFMSELMEIQCIYTTPYLLQSGSLIERFNSTLINMFSEFCNEKQDDWDQYLPYLLCVYWASVNESTGCTPNLLMLGREITFLIDTMYPSSHYEKCRCHNEYIEWIRQTLQDSFDRARQQLQVASERQKRYCDVPTKDRQHCDGDFVLRFYPPNLKSKLNPPYIDPFRVMLKLGDVIYMIQRTPKSKAMVAHVDHLKMCHVNTPPDTWPASENGNQHLSPESDSQGIDAADGCDDRVCVDMSRDVDHPSESSMEP